MRLAVVGMSCRVPGGPDPETWAAALASGVPAIGPVPPDRWDAAAWTDEDGLVPGRIPNSDGGFLADLRMSDAAHFGISPYEAARLDPRQLLLLELAWSALREAGLDGGGPGGLFVGVGLAEHLEQSVARGELSPWLASAVPNVVVSAASGRLGLTGASLAVDMGCASALAAIHLAARAIASGELPWAVAGGVHAILAPTGAVVLAEAGMLSPSGRCRPFSPRADGWARGEGGALVVLRPLDDARARGDRVLAVLEGSALLHCGAPGMAPDPAGIARTAREALAAAGVGPAAVGLVEAHGVGTPASDAAECEALAEVFDGCRAVVGAGKAWTGHLEWAAGAAAVVKTVLALRRREIPGQPDGASLPGALRWADRTRPWDGPDRALVQGFALGGSHAALVLGPGDLDPARPTGEPVVWTCSAPTLDDLPRVAGAEAAWLSGRSAPVPPRRTPLPARVAVAGRSGAELARALRAAAGSDADAPRVALLFTGQGSQHPEMGQAVADPVFRAAWDAVDALCRPALGRSLRGLGDAVHDTRFAQPALFALEWALWKYWENLGLRPVGALGHSLGELVALTVAGAWSLEDGVRLVLARARAMADAPAGGAMAAVLAPEDVVRAALRPGAELAAVNGAEACVVSGDAAAVDAVCAALEDDFWGTAPLRTSHAFHSAHMEPALPAIAEAAAGIRALAPRWPVIGNRTAAPLGPPTPGSVVDNVRGTVRFARGLRALDADLLLELGPRGALTRLAARDGRRAVSSLEPDDEPLALARAAAALITAGVRLDLPGRAAPAPPHPFRRAPPAAEEADTDPVAAAARVSGRAIAPDRPWMEQGLGSLELVAIARRLSDALGRPVPVAALFEHPTPERLRAWLARPTAVPSVPARAADPRAAIALIGAGVRLPGGIDSPEALWDFVDAGRLVARPAPVDRPIPGMGGFLDDIDTFDAPRFGLDPAEAARLDPHHRLLLGVAIEALEEAGCDPPRRRGLRVGCFVAQNGAEWAREVDGGDLATAVGALPSAAAGRVAWHLDLDGPAITVDTACSGSLVAVHLAVQALRAGECDVAIAGGVSLQLDPATSRALIDGGATAADGRTRAFEASASGYGRSEGCAVVVLRREADALGAGDPIRARILGSAVGHDGRGAGFVAPSGPAQEAVVRRALNDAGVRPGDVGLVEAHGTGTPLGDPIEARALARVFPGGVAVVAGKRAVGHTEAAAGAVGLLLAAESVRRGRIGGQPAREAAAPSLAGLPLRFPDRQEPWPVPGAPIAGVSAFGMTGTNAHIVVGAPPEGATAPRREPTFAARLREEGLDPGRPLAEQGVDSLRAIALGLPRPVDALATAPAALAVHGHGAPGPILLALPPGVPDAALDDLAARLGAALRVVRVPVGESDPAPLLPHLRPDTLLAGWSLGAHVACRAARVAPVGGLVLIDASPDPATPDEPTAAWLFAGAVALRAGAPVAVDREAAAALGVRRALRRVLEGAIEAGLLPPDHTEAAFHRAWLRYRHGLLRSLRPTAPYDGPCLSLVAERGPIPPSLASWGPRCAVRSIPGDHFTLWREGLDALAAALRGSGCATP